MSCNRRAGPTPSQEIIGQLNCANVGPLHCIGEPPAANPCAGVGYSGTNCSDFGSSEFRQSGSGMSQSRPSNHRTSSSHDPCGAGGGDAEDPQYLEGCRRIVDSMNRLWQEQKLCDVIIQAQCDQLKCHKLALAAYSDFLVEKFCKFPPGCVCFTLRWRLTACRSVVAVAYTCLQITITIARVT